jgi:hypothetical protein
LTPVNVAYIGSMSTEEQDLILGRATRESKECRTKIGALEAKLFGFSDLLSKLVHTLNGTCNSKPNPVTGIEDAVLAVRRMPDPESIVQILNDLQTERDRLSELQGQLGRMGM